jgi:hypothetical protein
MTTTFPDPFQPPPAPEAPSNGMARIVEPERDREVLTPLDPTLLSSATPKPKPAKKKSRRLNLDSIFMLVFSLLIVMLLMITSFIASYNAIFDAAQYTGTPEAWRWVFPIFIDVAIFGYTINLFIFRHRKKPIGRTIAGLLFFAFISVAVNFAHTLAFWNGDLANYQAWIGVLLAVSAPIAVLLASEELGRLAFVEDDEDE